MEIVSDNYYNYREEQAKRERSKKETLKSVAFYREMAKDNPDTYEPKVAESLHHLATLYDYGDREESEPLYWEALEIRRRLCAKDPEKYESAVAETARCLGIRSPQTSDITHRHLWYL